MAFVNENDEELTRTRKVRRKFVLKRYNELVEALYGDQAELDIEADIKYRDGTGYRMKTRVMIKPVD